jgi:hypothetical protein
VAVLEREIERVMLAAMWERAQANRGERDHAPNVTEMARRVTALVEAHYQGAVERVVADDEAMRRARHAYLNSAPHGTMHDDAARLEHMRAAFRAAFAGK